MQGHAGKYGHLGIPQEAGAIGDDPLRRSKRLPLFTSGRHVERAREVNHDRSDEWLAILQNSTKVALHW